MSLWREFETQASFSAAHTYLNAELSFLACGFQNTVPAWGALALGDVSGTDTLGWSRLATLAVPLLGLWRTQN